MEDIKKIRICVFLHFSVSEKLPYYAQIYIDELSRHFDKIKVLTNNSKIQNQINSINANVSFEYKKNQGYDFGMFYRFIGNKNLENYSEVAVVNDSNILFNKLDTIFTWGRNNKADFWGALSSSEKPWFSEHLNNYHIQSHFIILNKKAIELLPAFFESIDTESIMKEENPKQLRQKVINDWEIGLSQFFLKNNLKADSFINDEKFRINSNIKGKNLAHSHYYELAINGYPLLKRKVALKRERWFKKEKKLWKETLLKFGNKEWDIEKIIYKIS